MPNFFVTIISKPVPHVLRHLSHVQIFAMTEVTEHAWPGLEMTVPHLTTVIGRKERKKERKRDKKRRQEGNKGKRKEETSKRSKVYYVLGFSSPLAWKIPWTEEPGRLHGRLHGVARSRTRLSDFTFAFHFHALEKEMATHSSVLAWRIPGMGKPGGLPSVGSHRVGHD